MASETDAAETQSVLERLISSRNRDLSLFIPFILGFNLSPMDLGENSPDSDPSTPNSPNPEGQRERVILINPLTQGMVVIEGANLGSLLQSIPQKSGQPPASKSSIEAMPSVEIRGEEDVECVICLEDWEIGGIAKEMPCKHRFHGNCIEKWLGIHGSCPICRYKMPIDEKDGGKKGNTVDGEEEREMRGEDREIWVSFSVSSGRRRDGDVNPTGFIDSVDTSSGDANQLPPNNDSDS
ncbi:hypothetical protein Nepgr_003568 [Nepenthes gracilis]|uniref:RING-type E3 ubiquitin transferase n=1 Tax=Nepenthes gracilis TaxID=150966 RepID=A0AAD3RZW0_NEPGR|nr:hypothetical protein Nepgr_003568 [Nepenthes gracilis]